MGSRKFLLPVAAVVAALGTLMVFLYAQGADKRAADEYDTVEVLTAVKQVEAGEAFDDAVKAGKFEMRNIAKNSLVEGYQTDLDGLSGEVATQTVFADEQVSSATWGDLAVASSALVIPDDTMAVAVQLTDPSRVAGFVNPGSEVAVFYTFVEENDKPGYSRLLLDRVKVLAIGDTSTVTSTKKNKEGEETTEEVPQTLMTLAVGQEDAQKLFFGANHGELSVGLLTSKTKEGKSEFTYEQNLFK